jgi:adenosylhomocysteinase
MGSPNMSKRLVEQGIKKIEWVWSHLRILQQIEGEFLDSKPFDGIKIGICLHVEPKTAGLLRVLQAGGAEIAITGSPGTTQDDVAHALKRTGVHVYGCKSDGRTEHLKNIQSVAQHDPHLFLDNGADLFASTLEKTFSTHLVGGTEETTSGANRLRSELLGKINVPVIVVNDSPLKRSVENEHGVGQTVVEGFMRVTNLIIPAKRFVVLGYGACGRGVARYLKKFGGRVTVVDIDPIRALEAAMDGMNVSTLEKVLKWGEVFITVTGHPDVIQKEHMKRMSDGVVLCNAGHFSSEIDINGLREMSVKSQELDRFIEEFTLGNGNTIVLLAKGEMVNLATGKGNPAETMDLGLALQAYSLKRVREDHETLPKGPQPVPDDINKIIARQMLETFSFGTS